MWNTARSRRTLLKETAVVGSAASLGFGLGTTQVAAQGDEDPQRGGTLRYAMNADMPSFDPHAHYGKSADQLRRQIYSGLFKYVRTEEEGVIPVPDLVESWEALDDMTYRFQIHSGVTFHNGDELTADDVKFSLERILDPDASAFLYNALSIIDSIEVDDPVTLTVRLKSPLVTFINILADDAATIVSQRFVEGGANLDAEAVGTGPFRLVEQQPNVLVALERYENYFETDVPYVDGITFYPYVDDTARVNALQTGSIDMINYLPFLQMASLEQDDAYKIYSDIDAAGMWLAFNPAVEVLSDVRVREAVAWAIDRQAIVDLAFAGRGEVMTGGAIPPSSWAYTDFDGTYQYDPERARSILAEAGYEDGLSVSLLSTVTFDFYKATSEVIQANLTDIGIEVNLELPDWPTNSARRSNAQFELYVQGSITSGDPDTWYRDFLGTGGPYNFGQWSDDTLDGYLDEARTVADQETRRALYAQAEERVLETLPTIFLMRREQGEGSVAAVEGYEHVAGAASPSGLHGVWLRG